MALLQEINSRLRSEAGRVWSKAADLAYSATIGLAKQYQRKALELIKITTAACYLRILSVLRKHLVLLFLTLLSVVVMAVTIVVVPVAMLLATPWTASVKVISLAVLGLLYVGIIGIGLQSLFSEEKWMKASGFQELLDSISTDPE